MATMIGKEKDTRKLVKDLIELDFDAIDAYDAAIERLDNASYKAQLTAFADDHRRHVTELSAYISELGETPPTAGDFKRVLTKGKVVLGALIGDRAILVAMKTNEDDTNTAYERAVARTGVEERLAQIFARNLADERRHRAWIEQTLASDRPSRGARAERPSSDSIA